MPGSLDNRTRTEEAAEIKKTRAPIQQNRNRRRWDFIRLGNGEMVFLKLKKNSVCPSIRFAKRMFRCDVTRQNPRWLSPFNCESRVQICLINLCE